MSTIHANNIYIIGRNIRVPFDNPNSLNNSKCNYTNNMPNIDYKYNKIDDENSKNRNALGESISNFTRGLINSIMEDLKDI